MRTLGWVLGVVTSLTTWGLASEARATCSTECEMAAIHDDCSEPLELEDGAYEWDRLDELRFLASCTEVCCVAPDCGGPVDVTPPLDLMQIRSDTEEEELEVEFSVEQACGGTMVSAPAALEANQRYWVAVEGLTSVTFETVDSESEPAGCHIVDPKHAPHGLGGLILLGLVARRRRA